jgi:hypothetical protein
VAYKEFMARHPLAKAAGEIVYYVITDITKLAGCTPKVIRESKEWANIVKRFETGRDSLCGMLQVETLFSALMEFI